MPAPDYLPRIIETSPWMLAEGGALDIDRCPDCWERRAHIERYVFACNVFRDMRVLDFGCGVGYGSEMLTASGNTVTAVDNSTEAIALCLARRPRVPGLRFREVAPNPNAELTPLLPGAWGGCVALEVLEHLHDPQKFLMAVPARHIVVSVPVRPTMAGNPHHRHDFTIKSFRAMLRYRFVVRSWWTQTLPFHSEPSVAIWHGEVRE